MRGGCLRFSPVEGDGTILSRAGLLVLRVCVYACGGVAAAFVLLLMFARPASAAQAPVLPGTAGSTAPSPGPAAAATSTPATPPPPPAPPPPPPPSPPPPTPPPAPPPPPPPP